MPINSFLYPGVKDSTTPVYDVANSLRFDTSSGDYLNRTQTSGNQKTFTFSTWVKRCSVTRLALFNVYTSSTNYDQFFLHEDGYIEADFYHSGTQILRYKTNALFRDLSAWYHIVFAVDTTQSTASNRARIYVNGSEITSFSTETDPSQNVDTFVNESGKVAYIGRDYSGNSEDYYLCETVFIDGQQLDPTSFGEYDSDTNIWKPIDVSGLTFGTNGFYLDYENSGSLGADVSGNGNNFTVNNLTSIDQSTDTCTNNYSTMNGLYIGSGVTMSEGNLSVAMNASAQFGAFSSIGVSTGKWYMEMKYTVQVAGADRMMVGISGNPANLREATPIGSGAGYIGADSESFAYYSDGGDSYTNEAATSYGNSWTVNDIIGIALDLDNNKLYFSKNGTWQNSGVPTSGSTGTGAISITAPSSLTTGNYFFAVSDTSGVYGGTIVNNFGSPSFTISSGNSDGDGYGNFEYAPPSGYYAVNTKNLAEYG